MIWFSNFLCLVILVACESGVRCTKKSLLAFVWELLLLGLKTLTLAIEMLGILSSDSASSTSAAVNSPFTPLRIKSLFLYCFGV